MEPFEVSASNTVCIGIEFAWWGGIGRGNGPSCADVIIGQQVNSSRLWSRTVDLRAVPNPLANDPCQPNYDADAALVTSSLQKELNRLEQSGARRFILAMTAPIATTQVTLPARRRVLRKGDKGGSSRRACENLVLEKAKAMGGPWARMVSVQPGAPLAPRVNRFLERLTGNLGFVRWDTDTHPEALPARVLIEVLPLEAIWALGVAGHYGDIGPEWVGRYRKCEHCFVAHDDAVTWAKWPLSGFAPLLGECCDVSTAVDAIAGWVDDRRSTNGSAKITKRYCSLVDAGIAWLTATAFRYGRYHVFAGADCDGCIVGPGNLETIERLRSGR